jgi:hypothetical protein
MLMTRLPELRPDELTPNQRRVYDEIAGTRGAVPRASTSWWR